VPLLKEERGAWFSRKQAVGVEVMDFKGKMYRMNSMEPWKLREQREIQRIMWSIP